MRLIAITLPHYVENEAEMIRSILDLGISRVHIRKQGDDAPQTVRKILDEIGKEYYPRISLHYHFDIASQYNIDGIHHSKGHGAFAAEWQGTKSVSCHTLEELKADKEKYDYCFLSPIFDSISKAGYSRAFTDEELFKASAEGIISSKVIALGGVRPERLRHLDSIGFGGAAILGGIWGDPNDGKVSERAQSYISAL